MTQGVCYTQIGTNGYFAFDDSFIVFSPFLFNENTPEVVAPFFTDINIASGSGLGQIYYETHTRSTSLSFLSQVNSVINEQAETTFNARWMLVATWYNVPPFGDNSVVSLFLFLYFQFFISYPIFYYRPTHFKEY